MKATTLMKAALVAGSLSFLAGSAYSQQSAVSGAGGYTTESLGVGFNLMGVSLHKPVALSGTFDSEAGATLTDADVDFSAVLTDPNATYLLEILDGTQAGAVAEIESLTATTVTVGASGLGAGAATYQIRAAGTLEDIFGDSLAGAVAVPGATTDRVWLPKDGGGFDQYFRHSGTGQYRSVALPFAATTGIPVFYPDALFVQVADTAKDVVITGMVKTTDTVAAAIEGFNLVGVTPPVGSTFGNSGMGAFLTAGGVVPTATTDRVWLPVAGGGFNQYFINGTGDWRTVALPFGASQNDTELTSGIFIQRNDAGDTGGALTVPGFYANL